MCKIIVLFDGYIYCTNINEAPTIKVFMPTLRLTEDSDSARVHICCEANYPIEITTIGFSLLTIPGFPEYIDATLLLF